ncbi:MAG: Na(+)-translocating NADH-quinone reductase subunit A [Flavobacteriales bacterium]|nr:Na(+)-translocating NADH-quinone reductase subunit A [Flavobacteriales bacterium]
MSQIVKISKGANIKLKGAAEKVLGNVEMPSSFAIKPPNFHGVMPKLVVKAGDKVKAGSTLFFDKYNEQIKFTSPVSGEVTEIVRGEKRRILAVKLKADKEIAYEQFTVSSANAEDVKTALLSSGIWPFVKQRPYDIIANPAETPKAIHITGLDTSPMAPDYDFLIHGQDDIFQAGLDALAKLTSGKVHLNINGNANADTALAGAKNVQVNKISGPHPAGNVGIQVHHIDPVNKGEVVWVLKAPDVLAIGKLFKEGKYDASKVIALTGSKVNAPKYYKVLPGASVNEMFGSEIKEGARVISGNVLSGEELTADGYLGFYDYQISAIPEGGDDQLFGWMAPGFDKFSLSKTFFSWLTPGKEYDLNTNMNGEERAFVVTGEYEKVFPMDILPVYLLKSMITEDIDAMEGLGVYEVAPEDFALCEYSCTSKIEAQKVVRKALDLVKQECS